MRGGRDFLNVREDIKSRENESYADTDCSGSSQVQKQQEMEALTCSPLATAFSNDN